MTTKRLYICDICGISSETEHTKKFNNGIDICCRCVRIIVNKVIDLQLMTLPPFCKKCNGTRTIETSEELDYHRNHKVVSICENCKI
jgi:hypothetical protein